VSLRLLRRWWFENIFLNFLLFLHLLFKIIGLHLFLRIIPFQLFLRIIPF
jgi:hypothetical protein